MKVFLTGATGYIGSRLLTELLKRGISVKVLTRPDSLKKLPPDVLNKMDIIEGDVLIPDTFSGKFADCDAVYYIPGLIREIPKLGITFKKIHFEGARNIINELVRLGIKRFILMSANGVRQNAPTDYLVTKYQAEEYLKESKLEWTIFRPSVVFGDEDKGRENFVTVIKDLFNKTPLVVPIIGNGNYKFQPISIVNLTDIFIKCLDKPESRYKTYHLCGPEVYSYNELVDIISKIINKKKIKIHIPVIVMRIITSLMSSYKWYPVTNSQISMLLENNICISNTDIWNIFGVDAINLKLSLHETLKKEGVHTD